MDKTLGGNRKRRKNFVSSVKIDPIDNAIIVQKNLNY